MKLCLVAIHRISKIRKVDMAQTVMYQIAETGNYMMSFVIVTQKDNVVVIDGGMCQIMRITMQRLQKSCQHFIKCCRFLQIRFM